MLYSYGFDLFSAVACETLDSLTIYFSMSSEGKQLLKSSSSTKDSGVLKLCIWRWAIPCLKWAMVLCLLTPDRNSPSSPSNLVLPDMKNLVSGFCTMSQLTLEVRKRILPFSLKPHCSRLWIWHPCIIFVPAFMLLLGVSHACQYLPFYFLISYSSAIFCFTFLIFAYVVSFLFIFKAHLFF